MGRSSDGVSSRCQQSPVVSSMGCADLVVYLFHSNGSIGNSCTITDVRDCAFYSSVDLQMDVITQI